MFSVKKTKAFPLFLGEATLKDKERSSMACLAGFGSLLVPPSVTAVTVTMSTHCWN